MGNDPRAEMAAEEGQAHSDAIVFFGATGDLAYKQIFPALAALLRDEGFDIPTIGVARSGDLANLRDRARASLAASGFDDAQAANDLVAQPDRGRSARPAARSTKKRLRQRLTVVRTGQATGSRRNAQTELRPPRIDPGRAPGRQVLEG